MPGIPIVDASLQHATQLILTIDLEAISNRSLAEMLTVEVENYVTEESDDVDKAMALSHISMLLNLEK